MVTRRPEEDAVGLRSLEKPVQVVLPRETYSAVDLQSAGTHLPTGVGRIGLCHRRRQRELVRRRLSGPARVVDERAGALDLLEHVSAGVRDGLVRADRPVELLA